MLEIDGLTELYRSGARTVAAMVADLTGRIAAGDPAIWIARVPPASLAARANALDALLAADRGVLDRLPLFGIPFAVKDNIDIADEVTTAGCPAFAYTAAETAPVVQRLLDAGAVLLGKTNLDQFATGLVGTRSPYGVPQNPFSPAHIPGGSSSGSAVAVARGFASFALGTDTAGSGRVPAAFNNVVGLKPTRGMLSIRGIVPACRSLDCVSILAATVGDAAKVFEIAAAFDPEDPFSRRDRAMRAPFPRAFRFGVPSEEERDFFGDDAYAALYEATLLRLEAAGGRPVEIALAPFLAAARLLYGGPWIAERLYAVETLLERAPGDLLDVTRSILLGGRHLSALDAYRGMYELAALRRKTEPVWDAVDVLALPTAGTIYRIADVEAAPLALNANLGRYTNFVNLLDLAALALPAGFRSDGLPFGLSLIAPAGSDRALLALGARMV